MHAMDALKRYFLTGTAEEDRAFLDRVFITHEQLAELLSIDPGTMRILAGSKGIGKTAFFEWVAKVAEKRHLPVLLIRPDNLDCSGMGSGKDIASLKHTFYNSLVSAIATKLGRELKGFLTGDAATLYNSAMATGARDPDFAGKILQILSAVSVPVGNINAVQLAKDLAGRPNPDTLMRAVSQHLLSKGAILFLLLDDTDQVASPTDATELNRIWALLLAMRRLAGECPALRCIASLRSEVWARLGSESAGQRDQTDHLRGLLVPLRASDDLMAKILRRRFESAAEDIGRRNEDPYAVFFENVRVRLPTSDELRPWETFIIKSARERPRDAIQLIRILADKAKSRGKTQIGDRDVEDGMKVYSGERIDDAANEFGRDCTSVKKVLETFVRSDFEMPFEKLRAHLKTVGSGFTLQIRGETIKPHDDDSAVKLLRFLFEMGFINPRIRDERQPRGFRHSNFQDEPDFVARANWNVMQGATWEIHPAFRSFLIQASEDRAARR